MYVWLGGCVCFEMLFKPLFLGIWWSCEMVNHKWCHLSAHHGLTMTGHTCWHNTEQTTYHICRHNTEWTLTYHTYRHDTERTMIDHNYQNDTGWGEAESLPSRTEPHPLDVVPCWTHWWRYLSTYGRVLSAVMMIFQTNRFFLCQKPAIWIDAMANSLDAPIASSFFSNWLRKLFFSNILW